MTAIVNSPLDSRVAATYKSKDDASKAKHVLATKLGFQNSKIDIIEPNSTTQGEKLKVKSKAIGKSMLTMHIYNALIGVTVGMILAFLLVQYGPLLAQNNPLFTYIAFISPGLFIGLFFAGIRSFRPQHDVVNQHAVQTQENKYWTLMIDTAHANVSKKDICKEIEATQYVELKVEL